MPIEYPAKASPFTNLYALPELATNQSTQTVARQVQLSIEEIYLELLILTEQSIFAPQEKIKYFRERFLTLIYQLDFDPLYGGLVLPKQLTDSNKRTSNSPPCYYEKPLLVNILLADVLFQSDQFLYTGELSQIGRSSIHYLISELNQSDSHLLQSQSFSTLPEMFCCFERANLTELLNQDEFNLLIAITSNCNHSEQTEPAEKLLCYFNTRSLTEAATSINMPIKQAQIVEHALNTKLFQLETKKEKKQSNIDTPLLTNCLLLQTLSKALLVDKQDVWQQSADLLIDPLLQLLPNQPTNSINKINILVTGFYYLQTNFSRLLVQQLIEQLSQIDFKQIEEHAFKLSGQLTLRNQLALIATVITEFSQCPWLEIETAQLPNLLAPYQNNRWKIEILKQSNVQLDRQLVRIKSEFHPYRLIFCI